MRKNTDRQSGYSLTELLTVVAMIGLVSLVALPALFGLFPQYRIRGAASELTSNLRMLRQKAIGTRSQWRMMIDPANDEYSLQKSEAGAWVAVDTKGKEITAGMPTARTVGADVDGTTPFSVTFQQTGAATAAAQIVLKSWSDSVTFNRYTIDVDPAGTVRITPSKV